MATQTLSSRILDGGIRGKIFRSERGGTLAPKIYQVLSIADVGTGLPQTTMMQVRYLDRALPTGESEEYVPMGCFLLDEMVIGREERYYLKKAQTSSQEVKVLPLSGGAKMIVGGPKITSKL